MRNTAVARRGGHRTSATRATLLGDDVSYGEALEGGRRAYDIDLPTAECQSRTLSEKRRVTRKDDASQGKKEQGARSRGACLDVKDDAFQEKDGYMDSRSVKDGEEDTDERVFTSHTEK